MNDVPDENNVCESCGQPAAHWYEGRPYCEYCWDYSEENAALWDDDEVDTSCEHCGGSGMDWDQISECPYCEGMGTKPEYW